MGERDATIIQLDTFTDERGKLTVAEGLPFAIQRAFWIHGVTGLPRGGHAHVKCEQMIVCMAGKFDISVDGRAPIALTTPRFGLYVPPGHVVTLDNWSAGAVALVLCSHEYDEDDYVY